MLKSICECRGLLRVALLLSVFDAAAAPPTQSDALEEAARSLVDVHHAVCLRLTSQHSLMNSRCVLGVLLLKAVELFHALGELLLQLKRMPCKSRFTQARAGTDVESLCVEPFVHQASDRHRAEAQDVGHPQDVLAQPCHVYG